MPDMQNRVDCKKIAELRLLLAKSRALPLRMDLKEALLVAVEPYVGELLALADAALKLRALFPGEPWPQWCPSDKEGVVLVRMRNIMRELEGLEKTAQEQGSEASGGSRPAWTQPSSSVVLWETTRTGPATARRIVEAWGDLYPGREIPREEDVWRSAGGETYHLLPAGHVLVSRPSSAGGSQIRLLHSRVRELLSVAKVSAGEPEWDDFANMVTVWSEDDADVGCPGHEEMEGALRRLFGENFQHNIVATVEDADLRLKLTTCGLVLAESYPGNSQVKVLRRVLGIVPQVSGGVLCQQL